MVHVSLACDDASELEHCVACCVSARTWTDRKEACMMDLSGQGPLEKEVRGCTGILIGDAIILKPYASISDEQALHAIILDDCLRFKDMSSIYQTWKS